MCVQLVWKLYIYVLCQCFFNTFFFVLSPFCIASDFSQYFHHSVWSVTLVYRVSLPCVDHYIHVFFFNVSIFMFCFYHVLFMFAHCKNIYRDMEKFVSYFRPKVPKPTKAWLSQDSSEVCYYLVFKAKSVVTFVCVRVFKLTLWSGVFVIWSVSWQDRGVDCNMEY